MWNVRMTKHVITLNFFQPYKSTLTNQRPMSPYLRIASKRRPQQRQNAIPPPRHPEGGVSSPIFVTCKFVVENIIPLFDSKWVLQRRTFFINDEQTPYVYVGFYPTRNYQTLLELGGSRIATLTLTDGQVTTLAIHHPRLCQENCTDNIIR
jgi:hypothetical protein